eukprot:6203060-Pleurochrysis_carterae.AAC.1
MPSGLENGPENRCSTRRDEDTLSLAAWRRKREAGSAASDTSVGSGGRPRAAETSRHRMAAQSRQQISRFSTKGRAVRLNRHLRLPQCGLRLAPRRCTPQESVHCVPG